jgi:hypothetical protein
MSKRLSALLLAGLVSLAGLALAQQPGAKEEPPVRLKKKPRGDEKPMVDPDKQDEKKKDDKKGDKKEDKKPEPREPEPVTPQEDEKEVFQRVVANVHKVDNRLAKNDLGEATQQTQRDILKDLESLIRRNENPPQGGGQDQNNGGGGGGQNSKGRKGGGNRGAGSKSGTQRTRGDGKSGGGKQNAQADGKNSKGGNSGGGGNSQDRGPNRAADQYKDIWGHLPQTLRAQMDAYSNPQPFMPKYDDLIKRYYQTIAEQGRRKGE